MQENADYLIKCTAQDLGFCQGKPVAAFTIYKCLIHWKSFEAERTSVFDRLIQMIGAAIEVTCLHYLKRTSFWATHKFQNYWYHQNYEQTSPFCVQGTEMSMLPFVLFSCRTNLIPSLWPIGCPTHRLYCFCFNAA